MAIITKQQLEQASVDANYLNRFRVGPSSETIPTEEGLKPTIAGIVQQALVGASIDTMDGFTFDTGATITFNNQALLDPESGIYYRWSGAIADGGKIVSANSNPAESGGIGPGLWLATGDGALRADLQGSESTQGAALVNTVSSLDTTKVRTVAAKLSEIVSINDFSGIDASGSADSTAGFTEAMTAGLTVYVPSGTTVKVAPTVDLSGHLIVDGTLVINSTCTLKCSVTVRAGNIVVNSGFNATFAASFAASPGRRIFSGAGNVYGIRHVYPEWWGAVADNTTDCAAAFNAMSACVEKSNGLMGQMRPTIELMSGYYLIKATWNIPSSANIGIHVKGQGIIFAGTRIVAAADFTGTQAVAMGVSSDSTQKILDFKLSDFGVVPQTAGSGPSTGIQLGSSGIMMNGLRESLVENLYLSNFTTSMLCLNTRLIKLDRVGIWNNSMTTASTCLMIQSDGKFAGDLSLENCQLVNNQAITGSRGIRITSNGTFSSSGERAFQVAGIRITECILYPADQTIYIDCLGGSHVEDIFINNCQFDGDSNSMIYCVSSGAGSILRDVQIINNYMFGGNKSTSAAQIQFITGGTNGVIQNVRVQSNTLGNGIGRAVNVTTGTAGSIVGVKINDNMVVDFSNASNPAIEIGGGCLRVQCNDNVAMTTASAAYPYFIQIDTGANYYVATGNLASGVVTTSTVREVTAGANRVVANNL